ncbi:MAG: ISAzo13 family transposase [Gammaproteobacteria bacterium]
MIDRIAHLLKHETAGDPMHGLKWTRKTTRNVAQELRQLAIRISAKTVGRLLKEMGFSLRVNHKSLESGNKNPPPRQVRNRQFKYINRKRREFASVGNPIISVDTKKKEKVGNFKNPGASWQQDPYLVNDHDFPNDAVGMAVPYGIFDTEANRGFVAVGTSHETPSFAVDSIAQWWKRHGRSTYPKADELLILADCGGGNSARAHAWKYHLQHQLCDPHGLKVTVCHYPPGASKWNPIEHHLFSYISNNWAGKPLESYETLMKYIQTTKTSTGLGVRACLVTKDYAKGEKISDTDMSRLALTQHKTLPNWNYTLAPSKM